MPLPLLTAVIPMIVLTAREQDPQERAVQNGAASDYMGNVQGAEVDLGQGVSPAQRRRSSIGALVQRASQRASITVRQSRASTRVSKEDMAALKRMRRDAMHELVLQLMLAKGKLPVSYVCKTTGLSIKGKGTKADIKLLAGKISRPHMEVLLLEQLASGDVEVVDGMVVMSGKATDDDSDDETPKGNPVQFM